MKKRVIATLVVILLPILMFIIDCLLAINDTPPAFAVRTETYKDGGTSIYQGLGYRIIDYNQLDGRQDVVFTSIFYSKGKE
ncbi:hypothetical protein [Brevibacillus formosus]|uniref:hypothetical protein n=1 Tax=Brevibacillus formosus TaxID=54913 RepID=UPI003F1A4DFF